MEYVTMSLNYYKKLKTERRKYKKRCEWLLVSLIALVILIWLFVSAYVSETEEANNVIEHEEPSPAIYELQPEKAELVSLGEFTITAYCPCEKCCGTWATERPTDENGRLIVYTSSGTVAKAGRTIAVDPKVIPYGTTVTIEGIEGTDYIAEDCGGSVDGKDIDIFMNDHQEALNFGRRKIEVFVHAKNV